MPSEPSDSAPRDAVALIIAGSVAIAHIGLAIAGIPGWPCIFKAALRFPCPGCGMTRATVALLRGHWAEALRLHAFAPLLVVAVGGMVIIALLPKARRSRTMARMKTLEQRWHLGAWLLAALLSYWLMRFLLDAEVWRQLSS